MHRISVIVSSYDHPRALALVLEGLRAQDTGDFEIIVADDGSDTDTFALLEEFQGAGLALDVVTQPDEGFRKSKAVNQAIKKTRGDQIVFLDGDCVPFPDFIRRHAAAYRPGHYCVGGYIWTSLATAQSLDRAQVRAGGHLLLLTPAERARLWGVHLRNRLYRLTGKRRKPKILGGNLSIARDALFAVNGFDEGFDGFSGEDSDIRNRLNNWGARGTSLWNRAFVCHLDHGLDPPRTRPEVVRKRGPSVRGLLIANRERVRTPRGLEPESTAG